MPCTRTWTSSRITAPRYIVLLAGDHIYKMDYEIMLRQHVDTGADVTIGCLEVPRMEATGFGVMHVDGRDRIVDFVEKPKDPPAIPDKPDYALASMGIYVFETRVPDGAAAPRRRRPRVEPRFRQGHHPLYRQERLGLGAPLPALLRALGQRGRAPTGATWARWMPTGRPISTSRDVAPAARPLRPRLADLDLLPRSPRRPSSCMISRAGAARRCHSLVSGDCIVSGAPLDRSLLFDRRAGAFLLRLHEGAVVLPYCHRRRGARLRKTWWSIAAFASRRGWWSARIRRSTPSGSACGETGA